MRAVDGLVRWGIVGCGNVTEVKSGPALQRAKGSELVAVMRRTASLAGDYARRHGVPRWYDDARRLIEDPEVDAVYVATPVGSHMEYALAACGAGKPCYVEKPMARCHGECTRMVEAFDAAGLKLFVAYYRRALPRFLKARELVRSGTLGVVTGVTHRFAEARHRHVKPDALEWRLVAEHSGGGIFMDLGSHALDIIAFIAGDVADWEGSAANVASPCDVEDAVAMSFDTEAGVPCVASWNFASAVRDDLIEVTGTEGRVSLSVFGDEPVRLVTPAGEERFALPNPKHIQEPMIQTVVDDILGRGACASTGRTAAKTARVMDRVLEGYYGTRKPGFWLDPSRWPGRRPRS
jgi:predicted dehydrogenase